MNKEILLQKSNEELFEDLDKIILPKVKDNKIEYSLIKILKSEFRQTNNFEYVNVLDDYLDLRQIKVMYPKDAKAYKEAMEENITNAIKLYEIEVNYTEIKTQQEIEMLAIKRDNGDLTARNQMIEANLRLVGAEAKKYLNKGLTKDEIIQEGNLGLIFAADNYERGIGNFSTYAVKCINYSILDAIRRKAPLIRIPDYLVDIVKRLRKFLNENNNEKYSISYLAEHLGETQNSISRALTIMKTPNTFTPLTMCDDEGKEKELALEDSTSPKITDEVERKVFIENLYQILDELPSDLKFLIIKRYGLKGSKEYTYQQIGDMLGVSNTTIKNRETKALSRIRESANLKKLDGFFEE